MPLFPYVEFPSRAARDKLVFMYYDKTGKGVIGPREAAAALQAAGALITNSELQRLIDAGVVPEKGLDFDAFQQLLRDSILKNFRDGVFSRERLRDRFRVFLDDKDTVSKEVLRYIMLHLGEKLPPKQTAAFLESLGYSEEEDAPTGAAFAGTSDAEGGSDVNGSILGAEDDGKEKKKVERIPFNVLADALLN
ncbi:unnamed protein product [Amoebophrya sp. A25]|nr:unnamed protein product [Amoebophrya sp. A25]|eukprot:GSA25T00003886001.1